jgi:hypothetical protein
LTLQNRVLPTGEITALPYRGAWMGNRGILHDENRQLGVARWRHRAWVCCVLSFKGRRRLPMTPGAYTELFFFDEPTALAAGHRPCGECRRADHLAFRAAWARAHGADTSAPEMDAVLHKARVHSRSRQQIRHEALAGMLPDGAMILHPPSDAPALIWNGALHRWGPQGYASAEPCPDTLVQVLTPKPTLGVLEAGYRPHPHASLGAGRPVRASASAH